MHSLSIVVLALMCVSYGYSAPRDGPGPDQSGPFGVGGPGILGSLQALPNSQQFTVCLQPVIGFVFTQMGAMGGRKPTEGPTREQFTQMCTLGKNLFKCVDKWAGGLPTPVSPDVRTLLQGSDRLMNFCDEPNAYEDLNRFVACGKKLDAAPHECPEWKQSTDLLKSKFERAQGSDPMTILRDLKVLDDMCCKQMKAAPCIKAKTERLCGAQDKAFLEKMLTRVSTEFGCPARKANCRA